MMVELTSCINPDDNDHIENLLADNVMDIKPRINRDNKCISLSATDAFDVILEAARNQITGAPTKTTARKMASATTSSGRPKMIHTEKTRVPVTDGKRKTKTLITKEVFGAQRGGGKGKTKPVVVEEPAEEEEVVEDEDPEEELPTAVEKPTTSGTRRSARTAGE
jgi:hypothetical protein